MSRDMRHMLSIVDQAAEHWIGWSRPPAKMAIRESDWTPDPTDAYCNRCGASVGPGEATVSGCATCRTVNRPRQAIGDGMIRLGRYVSPLRQWLLDTKYQPWPEMAFELGLLLGSAVERSDLIDSHRAVIVPMPMPWQRRIFRGIDHAGEIARGVSSALNAPIVRLLAKRNGPPQSSLTPTQRASGLGRRLRLRRRWGGWPVGDMDLIVVDDIRTSGGSLRTAVRQLRRLRSRRVVGAVLAVADEASRRDRRIVADTRPTASDAGTVAADEKGGPSPAGSRLSV